MQKDTVHFSCSLPFNFTFTACPFLLATSQINAGFNDTKKKVFLTVVSANIGVNSGTPIDLSTDSNAKHSFPFKQWMKNRNIDWKTFKDWIDGSLPFKMFMPLQVGMQ